MAWRVAELLAERGQAAPVGAPKRLAVEAEQCGPAPQNGREADLQAGPDPHLPQYGAGREN